MNTCPFWVQEGGLGEGAQIGDTVVLTLYVIANPKPHTYTWTFLSQDGQQATLSSNTVQANEEWSSVLTITDIKQGNFGRYSCLVTNGIGGSEPIEFILASESNCYYLLHSIYI